MQLFSILLNYIIFIFEYFPAMGVDSEESFSLMKIVNERIPISESSLACTCDSQPFACEACDFTVNTAGDGLGGRSCH